MIKYLNRLPNRSIWMVFSVIFTLLLLFNVSFLIKIPLVWPDESFIADTASNILSENRNGTDLLKTLVPGVEKFGWGYPPLFFYTTAAWFKIFGLSIYNQRLLSLVLGTIFLSLFLLVNSKSSPHLTKRSLSSLLLFISLLGLATDPALIKAMHIGRPEIEVLVFGFISLFFYLKSLTAKSNNVYSLIAGFSLALAFLSHFLAIIFLCSIVLHILILRPKEIISKKSVTFLSAFLLPVLIWLFLISDQIHFFLSDVVLRINYKSTSPYWIWIIFSSSSLITKLQYILYFIVTWEITLAGFSLWSNHSTSSSKLENKNGILVALLLIFSWFWTYLWQAEYSFIFTVVFVYMALNYLIFANFNIKNNLNPSRFKVFGTVIILMLVFNLFAEYQLTKDLGTENFDYNLYTDRLLELVPDNTSVYMSAIPDPYYGFKGYRNNKLSEYPILPTGKDNLLKVLDQSDYIIFNAPLESIVVGNTVMPYIQANAADIKQISENLQYQAIVVKLKPRQSRIR